MEFAIGRSLPQVSASRIRRSGLQTAMGFAIGRSLQGLTMGFQGLEQIKPHNTKLFNC